MRLLLLIRKGLRVVKWPLLAMIGWFGFAFTYQVLKINGMPSYVGLYSVVTIVFIIIVLATIKWD